MSCDETHDTLMWVLENAMNPKLNQVMHKYYTYFKTYDYCIKYDEGRFSPVYDIHSPHAGSNFSSIYNLYLRKNWMKVVFTETLMVMKMLMK